MSALISCTVYNPSKPLHKQLERACRPIQTTIIVAGRDCQVSIVEFKTLEVAGELFKLVLTRTKTLGLADYIFTVRREGSGEVREVRAQEIEGFIAGILGTVGK